MGQNAAFAYDQAVPILTSALTPSSDVYPRALQVYGATALASAGQTAGIELCGDFNVAVWNFTSGPIAVQKSFDAGTTWIAVSSDNIGTVANVVSLTGPIAIRLTEPEQGVLYRLSAGTLVGGPAQFRLSQSNDTVISGGVTR